LFDKCRLSVRVGPIILTWPTHSDAHTRSGVTLGSDNRYLSDTIKDPMGTVWKNFWRRYGSVSSLCFV